MVISNDPRSVAIHRMFNPHYTNFIKKSINHNILYHLNQTKYYSKDLYLCQNK